MNTPLSTAGSLVLVVVLASSVNAQAGVKFQDRMIESLGDVRSLIESHPDFENLNRLSFKNTGQDVEWPIETKIMQCGSPLRNTGEHIREDSADLISTGPSIELVRCMTESEFPNCYRFFGAMNPGTGVQVLSFKEHFRKGSTPHMRYKEGVLALQFVKNSGGAMILQAYGILGGAEREELDTSGPFTGRWPSRWVPAHYGPNTDVAKVELTCSPGG